VIVLIDFCLVTKESLQIKIGLKIKELRIEKGWNQSDLARACEKDRQAIEKIENGKVNSTIFTLHQIAKALNVAVAEMLHF